jgi:hypothetical protein
MSGTSPGFTLRCLRLSTSLGFAQLPNAQTPVSAA